MLRAVVVAQLVEQCASNARIRGSNPAIGRFFTINFIKSVLKSRK